MKILTLDIDFDFEDFENNKQALIDLEKEGWEINPPISTINEDHYEPTDIVGCYALRKWE